MRLPIIPATALSPDPRHRGASTSSVLSTARVGTQPAPSPPPASPTTGVSQPTAQPWSLPGEWHAPHVTAALVAALQSVAAPMPINSATAPADYFASLGGPAGNSPAGSSLAGRSTAGSLGRNDMPPGFSRVDQLGGSHGEATWQQVPAALIARLSDLSVLQLPAVVLPRREMHPPGGHPGTGLRFWAIPPTTAYVVQPAVCVTASDAGLSVLRTPLFSLPLIFQPTYLTSFNLITRTVQNKCVSPTGPTHMWAAHLWLPAWGQIRSCCLPVDGQLYYDARSQLHYAVLRSL